MLQQNTSDEVTQKHPLKRIPLLSEEGKRALSNGETINFKESYLSDWSGKRAGRHLTAQLATHALYDIGARIINQDADRFENCQLKVKGSSQHELTAAPVESCLESSQLGIDEGNGEKEICHASGNLVSQRSSSSASETTDIGELTSSLSGLHIQSSGPNTEEIPSLIDQYNRLPQLIVHSCGNEGKNPLQALFILKVALELSDLNAEDIYEIYQHLDQDDTHMTFGSSLQLPNGSGFISEHGLRQFIESYIHHNPKQFPFLTAEQLAEFSDFFQCSAILGKKTDRSPELTSHYQQIMSREIPCSTQLTIKDGHEGSSLSHSSNPSSTSSPKASQQTAAGALGKLGVFSHNPTNNSSNNNSDNKSNKSPVALQNQKANSCTIS